MLLLRVADEREAVNSVNWGSLVLVGGVAMPTLIPTTLEIAARFGGTVSVTALVAGANSVVYCPFSTLGAMTLATVPEKVDRVKYFNKMLITGTVSVLFVALMTLIGVFALFA